MKFLQVMLLMMLLLWRVGVWLNGLEDYFKVAELKNNKGFVSHLMSLAVVSNNVILLHKLTSFVVIVCVCVCVLCSVWGVEGLWGVTGPSGGRQQR